MGLLLFLLESLDELTDMVLPLFVDVENKSVPLPEWPEHPYGLNEVQVLHLMIIYWQDKSADVFSSRNIHTRI